MAENFCKSLKFSMGLNLGLAESLYSQGFHAIWFNGQIMIPNDSMANFWFSNIG